MVKVQTIMQYCVAGLFAKAYGKTATNHNALCIFAKTGILL